MYVIDYIIIIYVFFILIISVYRIVFVVVERKINNEQNTHDYSFLSYRKTLVQYRVENTLTGCIFELCFVHKVSQKSRGRYCIMSFASD